jgi:RHS repeat-associated protein
VTGITNNGFSNRSQSFAYDTLNRITSATTTATHATDPTDCWGEAYLYDNLTTAGGAWGNLTSIGVASSAYTGCTQENLSQSASTSNRLSGLSYDTAGNVLSDGMHTYTYNAENQLTSAAGVNYTYDGDGKRVEKSGSKLYWYGMQSDALMETDLSGNLTYEYIFFGGKRIARRDSSNNVVYYVADHLGTSRVVFGSDGILDQSDFYPFGGERVLTSSSGNTYKFTGKERDSESNLDNFGARYNSSITGRFMSPDPDNESGFEYQDDPQGWNGYSYARNNPLLYSDPNGEIYQICIGGQCVNVSDDEFDQAQQTNGQGGLYLKNGGVYYTDQNGNQIQAGTYVQTSVDLNPFAQGVGSRLNRMPIQKFIGAVYIGSVVLGATGGAACYYFCPEGAVPTLGIEGTSEAGAAESEGAQLTEHAAQRLAERGISPTQAQEAIKTAEEAGNVTPQTGKYGTSQTVYKGTNGVTVVVENAGRNAGKIITAWFH